MDYLKQYRRFIASHYVSDGIRITFGIAFPAVLLGYLNLLPDGIALSLGAMSASTTDIPGPIHHRRNGMIICIGAIILVVASTVVASPHPWWMGVVIILSCFIFCMIGVYGARAISIGVAALLIMVLSIDRHMEGLAMWHYILLITIGGAWYMLLSLALYSIRPYKLVQQALGECILITSDYLRTRALFYSAGVHIDEVYREMLEKQIKVEQSQQLVSELLYKNRRVIKESIPTGRILMMIFLDMTDLFEKTATSFQDYNKLHSDFDDSGFLQKFEPAIYAMANELDEIGLAVQSGYAAKSSDLVERKISQLKDDYEHFRNSRHTSENLEGLINLRQILQSLEDIADRLLTLQLYTTYDKKKISDPERKIDFTSMMNTQHISMEVLVDNFTFQSNTFRHAIRVSIATLAGYIISRYFL